MNILMLLVMLALLLLRGSEWTMCFTDWSAREPALFVQDSDSTTHKATHESGDRAEELRNGIEFVSK